MTISVLEAHLEYERANRATKMIDMAQAATYAQATANSRSKMWNMWTSTISRITHMMNLRNNGGQKSTLTWNGEVIDKNTLIQKFRSMFGRRAVE